MAKRYYWLKLKNDFFNQREIKKLRKVAGGDTFTIIYLKMQLLSIKNEGIITYEGTEEDLSEQLAVELDEDIENVQLTIAFLMKNKLLEQVDEDDYLLSRVPDMIGSEGDSAERVRRLRQRKNEQKALPSNGDVTKGNTEIEKEKEKEIEKDKSLNDDIRHLFQTYLDQDIINHKSMTNKMRVNAKARLKEYTLKELEKAIKNYAYILKHDSYYWNYKWRFDDLFKPSGITKFLDESDPFTNFKKNEVKKQSNGDLDFEKLLEEFADE